MRVTVLGANGAIGRATTEALARRGHQVRAVARRAPRLEALFAPLGAAVERQAGDVEQPAELARAVEGADAVVFTVGLPYTAKGFGRFPAVTRATLDACRAAGVKAFVAISNEYPYGMPQTRPVTEAHPIAPVGPKGEARAEQERVVFAAHQPGVLHTAVLRLPTFFGRGSEQTSAVGVAAVALARGKPAPVLAPLDTPHEWVMAPDVGEAVARLLERDACDGGAYNMAGSGMYSPRQLVAALSRAAGAPEKMRVLPVWFQRVLGWFVPLFREMREVRYLVDVGLELDERRLEAALGGPIHHTPLDEACRQWIADLKGEVRAAASTSSARPRPASG